MQLRRGLTLSTLAVIASLAVAPSYGQQNALLTSMKNANQATAALASSPPWAYVTPSGDAGGYLVDVTNMALQAMGAPKVTAVLTGWDGMIPGLQAHRFDLIPAGLLITPARCKAVAFSAPITAQQDGLYVMPGNPKHLTGYVQVARSPDLKIAAMSGSAQEAYALSQGIKPDQIVRVPDIQAGISTVKGGRADAFVVGQFSVPNPKDKGVEVVVDKHAPVMSIGVAFRQDDKVFRDMFNKQLETLRANGTMKKLYSEKYGFPNWNVLEKTTALQQVASGCE